MDVRLPDGTVIQNVPEGTTKEQLVEKLAAKGYDVSWHKPEVKPVTAKADYAGTAEEMPFLQQLAAGAGGAVTGMGLGLRQLTGINAPSEEEVQEYQRSMQGLRGTGGGLTGEIAANILPGIGMMRGASAIPAVASRLAAGGMPAAKTIAATGGAIGAAEGAMTPVTEDQSRAANIAIQGTLGAAAPAIVGGVTKTLQTAKDAVMPYFSKGARQVAAGQMMRDVGGEAAIPALRQAQPGQTVGQAAVGENLPELAALQKVATDLNPDAAFARELQQREARQAALLSFGKTPEAIKAAEDARGAAMDKAVQEASEAYIKRRIAAETAIRPPQASSSVTFDSLGMPYTATAVPVKLPSTMPAFEALKANPGFKAALADARRIAGSKKGLPEEFMDMSDAVRKSIVKDPLESVQGLKLIKAVIDDRFANPSAINTSLSKIDDRTVTGVKKAYMAAVDKHAPEWADALDAFTAASRDITEMKIGQKAADILAQPIGAKERGAQLARVVEDELALLRQSGGFTRKELAEQLKPENMAKLQKVVNELDIDARFQEQAAKGMRGERLKDAVGSAVELPHILNNAVVLANNAIRKIAGGGKVRTIRELSEIMLDPAMAAKVMEKASKKEQNAIRFLVRAQQTGAIISPAVMETAE